MNRRLFVGQIFTGVSLIGTPSSLIARSLSSPSGQLGTANSVKNIADWARNGSLGSLQQITLAHVYSPERTSLLALVAMVQKDLATVNTLLGTDFSITGQALSGLALSEHGSYSIQKERAGVKITWQGLARIGGESKKPVVQLRLHGDKGTIQANSAGSGYQLVDMQGKVVQMDSQLSQTAKRINRRSLFTV